MSKHEHVLEDLQAIAVTAIHADKSADVSYFLYMRHVFVAQWCMPTSTRRLYIFPVKLVTVVSRKVRQ